METFIHLKENTPLKFDVILFQVTVLRCKLVIGLNQYVEISHWKVEIVFSFIWL